MNDELTFAGVAALAARVRGGEVAPRELVQHHLDRISALDARLNAFRITLADQALAEADALAARSDLAQLPLAGVPFAVKDEQALAGQAATRGSRAPTSPATADDPLVAALRAAGAIPVGITNVPELMVFPWTASAANGITRNPWDPSRTPGGSSGGSAAAVAAGLVPFATAADGGGSIRIPAAACGLPGLKRGRRPDDVGWFGLTVDGTLSRTVTDTVLLSRVTHGLEPSPPPAGLRIAVAHRPPPGGIAPLSSDQRRAVDATARQLGTLGHHVVHRAPRYRDVQVQFLQIWLRGVYEESLTVSDRSTLQRETRGMAAGGRYLVPPWRRDRVLAAREATTRRILSLWDDVDVLLTPALARTAIAAEGGYGRAAPRAIDISGRFSPFTSAFNLTGQPAIALPAGFGGDGLPLSVQLVGRPGEEGTLLALAAQLEGAAPWADARPPVS